jgi:tetratricopeptide (TPR) repeat protein
LEELYGDNAETHAAELAHHIAEAEAITGPVKLANYSLLAGERALETYAWEEALAHFQRGLDARVGEPVDAQAAALWFGLGRSQAATLERTQLATAVESLKRAFNYYEEHMVIDRAVAVAEYRLSSTNAALFVGATQLIPRALNLVPPNSLQAGYLLSRYGMDLGRLQGNYEGAQEAFARALKIAERENDPLLEIRTRTGAAELDNWFCRFDDTLAKCLPSIELAKNVNDPIAEASAQEAAEPACTILGDPDEANSHSMAWLEIAKRIGHRDMLG